METAYLRHVMKEGSDSTRQVYPFIIKPILRHFESMEPVRITTADIIAFITARRAADRSKGTCNKYLSALRIMFDYLVSIHAIETNPARAVKDFTDTRERVPRVLYPEELQTFFEKLKGCKEIYGYFGDMCMMYLYTGLRRAELLRLRIADVSLRNKTIRVEKTKNNKERIVEIHPLLVPTLKSVLQRNGQSKDGYFFGGRDVPLCKEKTITRAFSRFAAGGTGINKVRVLPAGVTLHSLRHTFITYLLKSGCDLKTVQAIAGHKKITTTHRYLHLIPGSENVSKIEFFTGDSQGRAENS